ncbi:MAG: GNAT family N-acetyltransferase [candidate division Zixibacteria bacterium]|nr:GNAT family N-acetyltransferase [candidate division Zixibacteria bacterium]
MKIYRSLTEQLSADITVRLTNVSLFASPGFAAVWKAHNGKPIYWVAEDSGEVLAIMPGVEFSHRPLLQFMSMPNGCYGGMLPLSDNSIDSKKIGRLILSAVANYGYAKVHIYDFRSSLPPDNSFRKIPCETRLVDISDPDWQPPDKKLRQQIRKAEKEGIKIHKFNHDQHISGHLDLVHIFEKRTGQKCKYRPGFFSELAALADEDDRLQWYWCEHNGHPVSSNIFIVEGNQLLHWQAYFDDTYSFLHPSKYIPFISARNAARDGTRYLNLGASPEGVKGVSFYKSKWGGTIFHYNCFERRKGFGRLL